MATSRLNRPEKRTRNRPESPDTRPRAVRRPTRRREDADHFQSGTAATSQPTQETRLASGLGWFGIGLGLAELLVPRRLARAIGVPHQHHRLIRAMGVREIANGMGIVAFPSSPTGVWGRVAGDIVDLACLGAAFASGNSKRGRLLTAAAAVAGATTLDVLCAQQLTRGITTRRGAIPTVVTLTINKSPDELYKAWRNFSNLPRWMKHLKSVQVIEDRRSHWEATGPAGSTVQWDAEITEDRSNEMIAWRSTEVSDIDHSGVVRFEPAPGNRGTMVSVEMQYRPPGGTIGSAVAAWFGDDLPYSIKMDLRRFKQVMETGEVITTEGQPAGRADSVSWKYDVASRQ